MLNKYLCLQTIWTNEHGATFCRQAVFLRTDPLYAAIDSLKLENHKLKTLEVVKIYG